MRLLLWSQSLSSRFRFCRGDKSILTSLLLLSMTERSFKHLLSGLRSISVRLWSAIERVVILLSASKRKRGTLGMFKGLSVSSV